MVVATVTGTGVDELKSLPTCSCFLTSATLPGSLPLEFQIVFGRANRVRYASLRLGKLWIARQSLSTLRKRNAAQGGRGELGYLRDVWAIL